jgi:hypothetical protein
MAQLRSVYIIACQAAARERLQCLNVIAHINLGSYLGPNLDFVKLDGIIGLRASANERGAHHSSESETCMSAARLSGMHLSETGAQAAGPR